MKQIARYLAFLTIFCFLHLSFVGRSHAAMDPKLKAFLITSGYGTGGGALLGLAAVALGSKPRSIAQGASLGLYAGMLFGGYIILSHQYRMNNPDAGGSFQDVGPYGGGAFDDGPYGGRAYRIEFRDEQNQLADRKRGRSVPPVRINLFHLRF